MAEKDERLPAVSSRNIKSEIAIAAALGAGSAGMGLLHPGLAIIAAGAAPFIQVKLQDMVAQRSLRFAYHLKERGVSLDDLSTSPEKVTPAHLDLLRETVEAALGTDLDEKISLLARILQMGLSGADLELMSAKRFARTVSRLDEIEFRVAWTLRKPIEPSAAHGVKQIALDAQIANLDLVRSALSILVAEGLARRKAGEIESWELTDYGRRFAAELQLIYSSDAPSKSE